MSRPDYALGSTIYVLFTSRNFSTGAPYTLAGTPTVSVYANATTTAVQTGVSVTADFNTVTGLNSVTITATSGNGYASGNDYDVVISAGTVNGVSVVGEVVFSFSIEKQSALRPATAGQTLAVDGSGDVTFNNTSIATVTNLTNLPSIPANWLTSTGIAASALNGKGDWNIGKTGYYINGTKTTLDALNDITTASVWDLSLTGHTTSGTTGAALNAAGSAGDPWSTAIPGAYGAGTAGNLLGNMQTHGDSTWSTATGFSVPGSAMTLTTSERTSVADALLDRDMSVGTDSGSTTVRTVRQALRFLRNKWAVATGTLTVYKENDTTASWTATVGTDSSALPIVSNTPA
jgi:hypothetical protein